MVLYSTCYFPVTHVNFPLMKLLFEIFNSWKDNVCPLVLKWHKKLIIAIFKSISWYFLVYMIKLPFIMQSVDTELCILKCNQASPTISLLQTTCRLLHTAVWAISIYQVLCLSQARKTKPWAKLLSIATSYRFPIDHVIATILGHISNILFTPHCE